MIEINNPLINHYIGKIRDKNSNSKEFNLSIKNIVFLMAGEISKKMEFFEKDIETPVSFSKSIEISDNICLVPILRAGIALLEPMREIFPYSHCGYMGIKRNYNSNSKSDADIYYHNLPKNLDDYKIYLLEVVLASGITLQTAINFLIDKGIKPKNITIVSIIACEYGIQNIQNISKDIDIYFCKKDELRLTDGYLLPGLGDAGDRYSNL